MFEFSQNNKIIYIILGLLILFSLTRISSGDLLGLVLTLPGVIIAITFHEYAHAFAAYRLGDNTPKFQGRLNLNPFSHMEPWGFILLLFVHIGWGKPVQINPNNFDRVSPEKGEAIVAVAGPLMNIALSIVLMFIYAAVIKFAPIFILTNVGSIVMLMLQYAIVVNIGLGVFNLIPLPPLDGSKIFIRFMPYHAKQWLYENQRIFYMIFLVLWITGLASVIISPIISGIYSGIAWCASAIFGLL